MPSRNRSHQNRLWWRWWPRRARGLWPIACSRAIRRRAANDRRRIREARLTSTSIALLDWPAETAIYSIVVITIGSRTDDTPH